MNKELRELLNSINNKKEEARKLVASDKLEEAKELKNEIEKMQEKFDLMKDLYEDGKADFEDNLNSGKVFKVGNEPENSTEKFANAARKLFKVNNQMSEGTPADGGYAVPKDVETKINHYRKEKGALQTLVKVTPVKTDKGSRTFKKRENQTGFTKVGEGAVIGKKATPQFSQINYAIDKYAGYFPVTNELLSDSDQNIVEELTKWIGDESRITRNKLILEVLGTKGKVAIASLDDMKKIINVTLDPAFKQSAIIVTNQDGFNWLDTLKDSNGRYLLEESLSSPTGYVFKKLVVHVYSNQDLPTAAENKVPMIIGDLKEAVELFDRQNTTIKASDVAMEAFENDLTLFRAIEREDVVMRDDAAFVYGEITLP